MNEVVAALAGAIVGAFATYLGAIRLHQIEIKDARKRFATALLAEGKSTRERYWEAFGKQIQELKPGEKWTNISQFVTTQNFLTVYDSNTDKLGLLEPTDINLVVRAATLAKGHIESINVGYRMVNQWTQLMHDLGQAGNPEGAKKAEQSRDEARVNVGKALREESVQLLDAIDRAVAALQKYTKG